MGNSRRLTRVLTHSRAVSTTKERLRAVTPTMPELTDLCAPPTDRLPHSTHCRGFATQLPCPSRTRPVSTTTERSRVGADQEGLLFFSWAGCVFRDVCARCVLFHVVRWIYWGFSPPDPSGRASMGNEHPQSSRRIVGGLAHAQGKLAESRTAKTRDLLATAFLEHMVIIFNPQGGSAS